MLSYLYRIIYTQELLARCSYARRWGFSWVHAFWSARVRKEFTTGIAGVRTLCRWDRIYWEKIYSFKFRFIVSKAMPFIVSDSYQEHQNPVKEHYGIRVYGNLRIMFLFRRDDVYTYMRIWRSAAHVEEEKRKHRHCSKDFRDTVNGKRVFRG